MSPFIKEFLWSNKLMGLRHLTLLALLTALLMIDPLFEADLSGILLVVLIFCAWLVSAERPRQRRILVVLAFPILALIFMEYTPYYGAPTLLGIRIGPILAAIVMVFLIYCGLLVLWSLIGAEEVGLNEIVGTINFYMITGYLWAYMYYLLERFHPGSFIKGGALIRADAAEAVSKFIYFSFVTLTTLGYGDITPQGEFAARLAILEAIIGQFYVAVVVTYLLTIFIGSRFNRD